MIRNLQLVTCAAVSLTISGLFAAETSDTPAKVVERVSTVALFLKVGEPVLLKAPDRQKVTAVRDFESAVLKVIPTSVGTLKLEAIQPGTTDLTVFYKGRGEPERLMVVVR